MKAIQKFFRERVFQDAFFKVMHAVIILGICYLFTRSTGVGVQASTTVFGINFAPNSEGLFGGVYTPFEAYVIFIFGIVMIIMSNISNMVRSWKFDVVTQYAPLIGINMYYWFFTFDTSLVPFAELNMLFVTNLAWNGSLRLARSEKDQRLVRRVFGRYVDNDVADTIISKGEKFEFDGQLRDMTVMFSDIRGFTSLSETLHPKRLISILSSYLTIMTDVILQNRGTIDKFIGDAVMAFWNAPTKDRNHSKNAIRTALKMQSKMSEIQVTIPELSKTNIGIGIARGPMVVGNVGGKNRFDYTVLGDTVNLASRLESLTKQYGVGILVNQGACEAMDGVIYRQIDVIQVKGKSQAVSIYQPLIANHSNQWLKEKYEYAFVKMQSGDIRKAYEIFSKLADKGDNPSKLMIHRLSQSMVGAKIPKVHKWQTK